MHHVFHELTGTELQNGFTSPITIPIPFYTNYAPMIVAWHTDFRSNGAAAFTVNNDLILTSNGVTLGECTNAIGATDKAVNGTVVSGIVSVVDSAALKVQVKTADPAGGGATARCWVRVWYFHNSNYDHGGTA